jgi:hypothetical protein
MLLFTSKVKGRDLIGSMRRNQWKIWRFQGWGCTAVSSKCTPEINVTYLLIVYDYFKEYADV